MSAFKERPAPPPGQKTLSSFIHVKEEQPAAEGASEDAAGVPITSGLADQAAAVVCAADAASKASADTQTPVADSSDAGTAQPELSPPPAQQGSRQRAEPDWFVGGRNGEDGFASCAPGRSFAASKASLMGSSGSQGSRSARMSSLCPVS